jgi:DNA recombination protein RmuC
MSASVLGSDGLAITLGIVLVLLVAVVVALGVVILRGARTAAIETRMAELAGAQTESSIRLQAFHEMLAGNQADLARAVNERLDAVSQHLSHSVQTTTQHTVESLRQLHERIAVIDSAQKSLNDLNSQVTSLRDVLANKQTRGAFGQARMEMIVQDALPKTSYAFQYQLSNRLRPDCAIFLPDKRPLVIDAKFPLEAVTALREAQTEEARSEAAKLFRQHIARHVSEIAEKYLIPGETQDWALMFVPSESLYAELHDGFDDIVQKAYRSRVVIVSPSLLMLAIQVIHQIQKDARMREAADKIRDEVGKMMLDVGRLHDRVLKLQGHFNQTSEDVRHIVVSAEKVGRRGANIAKVEFHEDEPAQGGGPGIIPPPDRAAGSAK